MHALLCVYGMCVKMDLRMETRLQQADYECSVETIWRTMLRLCGRSCTIGRSRVSTHTFWRGHVMHR